MEQHVRRSSLDERFGVIVKTVVIVVALVLVKYEVHVRGYEFIETLSLLTALMGGVVFTLALLLAGVLTDFKESERIVGELASHLRRIHWDLAILAKGDDLPRLRGHLFETTRAIAANLRDGRAIHLREVYAPLAELDRELARVAGIAGANSAVRTIQVGLGNVVRIVERLETIIETTFIKAGYYFAGAVVAVAITGLVLADLGPLRQELFLVAFAAFLQVGLFWLVWDLDNPFEGTVRITTRQIEKLERQLAAAASPP